MADKVQIPYFLWSVAEEKSWGKRRQSTASGQEQSLLPTIPQHPPQKERWRQHVWLLRIISNQDSIECCRRQYNFSQYLDEKTFVVTFGNEIGNNRIVTFAQKPTTCVTVMTQTSHHSVEMYQKMRLHCWLGEYSTNNFNKNASSEGNIQNNSFIVNFQCTQNNRKASSNSTYFAQTSRWCQEITDRLRNAYQWVSQIMTIVYM